MRILINLTVSNWQSTFQMNKYPLQYGTKHQANIKYLYSVNKYVNFNYRTKVTWLQAKPCDLVVKKYHSLCCSIYTP